MWTADQIPDQTGKTIIVTGANTGIGFETAATLVEHGAHVILACRDLSQAQSAVDRIKERTPLGQAVPMFLDLFSMISIEMFADKIKQKYTSVDVLINNAGIMTPPRSWTPDGYELQFGVNHLGHFALTGQLYNLLSNTQGARIVTVTSLGYIYGKIDFDNLKSERSYDAFREYCQSKLANLLFTIELQRRISAKGDQVISLAAHPGLTETDLSRHMSATELASALENWGPAMETWQGALPSLYASVSANIKGGALYGPDGDTGLRGYPAETAIQEIALDKTIAQRLWELSEAASGTVFP